MVLIAGMEKNKEPVCPMDAHFDGVYGMTKREYIATHIMAGYAANTQEQVAGDVTDRAGWAVLEADALLAALAK